MLPKAELLYETQGCGDSLAAFRTVARRFDWGQ